MSNALEAASLIMVPSGYEDGTLASVKPNDGTGDFTFSRGSNLSATRINEQGYIDKGYENLLLQSNQFDTTWSNANTTETGGQADKDGGATAWLLEKSAANGYIYQNITQGGVQTFSVYAKAGTSSWLRLAANTSNFKGGYFDLSNGVTGGVENATDTKIENVGNGWYRCSVIFNGNTTRVRVYPAEANSAAATTGSIYIQDAMLNQGLVAYPYIETTTATAAGGILEDMPRLDYSNGSCPALLLEPQRTNLITYSEFTDVTGVWFDSGATIDHNTEDTLSPEGYYNALKYNSPIATGSFYYSGMPVSQNTKYTFTFYVKKGTNENTRLAVYDETNLSFIDVDVPYTASTEEWTRIKHTFTTPANCTSARVYPQRFNSAGTIYFYGFQVEQDATYETSYIPTYGVSQTRLRDDCVNAGDSSLFNSTGGVLFFEASALFDDTTRRHISVSDGSTNDRLVLRYDTSSNSIQTFVQVGGLIYANLRTSNYTITDNLKMAFKWESGNQKLYVNGQIVDSSTDVFAFSQNILNNLSFTRGGTSQPFYGNTKQLAYFPTALTDSECIELTTI